MYAITGGLNKPQHGTLSTPYPFESVDLCTLPLIFILVLLHKVLSACLI